MVFVSFPDRFPSLRWCAAVAVFLLLPGCIGGPDRGALPPSGEPLTLEMEKPGGFYDRTLSFKTRQQNYKNPKLYGLAFDCQEVAKLNVKPWDIKLDAIITPSKIY